MSETDINHIQCEWPGCQTIITWKMATVTMNRYHKVLCVPHQIDHVTEAYANMPKLRDNIIAGIKERFGIT